MPGTAAGAATTCTSSRCPPPASRRLKRWGGCCRDGMAQGAHCGHASLSLCSQPSASMVSRAASQVATAATAASLPSLPLQGTNRLEAGALTLKNNWAMQQAFTGMPDRCGAAWVLSGAARSSGAGVCRCHCAAPRRPIPPACRPAAPAGTSPWSSGRAPPPTRRATPPPRPIPSSFRLPPTSRRRVRLLVPLRAPPAPAGRLQRCKALRPLPRLCCCPAMWAGPRQQRPCRGSVCCCCRCLRCRRAGGPSACATPSCYTPRPAHRWPSRRPLLHCVPG